MARALVANNRGCQKALPVRLGGRKSAIAQELAGLGARGGCRGQLVGVRLSCAVLGRITLEMCWTRESIRGELQRGTPRLHYDVLRPAG